MPVSLPRFEFGSFGPLVVRRERVPLGSARPVRILYASDLHLGHWWTRPVSAQLVAAARNTEPDVVLLGGDLVDHRGALPELRELIEHLVTMAPVHAVPGNHDARAGIPLVRDVVLGAGAGWLPDGPAEHPLRIDGALGTAADRPRLLCAHFPDIFPAAVAAGYSLVLAGHLHGGQCVLATHRDRLYPAAWLHRWHGLRFEEPGALMLVSRGAGDTLPFRFNCPREVILCEVA